MTAERLSGKRAIDVWLAPLLALAGLLAGGCGSGAADGAPGAGGVGASAVAVGPARDTQGAGEGAATDPGSGGRGGGFKVVHWNVKHGWGKAGWQGTCAFSPGADCSANAWGSGVLKRTLIDRVAKDPEVVALTLNEGNSCATPKRVQSLLGWPAVAPDNGDGQVGGVGIVARYGFAGPSEQASLSRCPGSPYQRYVVHAPVYADEARTTVVQVYATHWSGCRDEADETLALMEATKGQPQLLVGDLNVTDPSYAPVRRLLAAGYLDQWPTLHGDAAGHTATWNNAGGTPQGTLYKRIDYAFPRDLAPLAMSRFNLDNSPGACVQSDHAGIVLEYAR